MEMARIVLWVAASALLGLDSARTEELSGYPRSLSLDWDRSNPSLWAPVVKSGAVHPLKITSAEWGRTGLSVEISFHLNQPARIWLAVYERGRTDIGPRGPFGAWLRLAPLYLFVASTPGQDFEAGDNLIIWDGNDWEGHPTVERPGEHERFEIDIIGLNILEDATVAGIAPNAGLADPWIDLRTNEVWMGEYDRDAPEYGGHRSGDIARAVLGTDFLANPNAWERWDANSVTDFEGARTFGGMRGDPDLDKQDLYYTTHYWGEGAGCYRMIINRPARTFEADTDWGDNGLAPAGGPDVRIMQMEVWRNHLVAANFSGADPPVSSVEFWDKGSGELVKSLDVSQWFTHSLVDEEGNEGKEWVSGPNGLSVHDYGIYLAGRSSPNIVMIDHDGYTRWVNRNGDRVGDRVTYELAAETGMSPELSSIVRINADPWGRVVFFSSQASSQRVTYGVLGRDGTGLFNIFADPQIVGPLPLSSSTFITIIHRDRSTSGSSSTWDGPDAEHYPYWHYLFRDKRGPWDGMYWDTRYALSRHSFERIEGQKVGAGMLLHIPYDLVTVAGPPDESVHYRDYPTNNDTTKVKGAFDKPGRPDSFFLGAAYPNPFNSETTIEFEVPAECYVQVDLFNAVGQTVASLVREELSAGSYRTTWDGLDQEGSSVSSGAYFYRMQARDFTATRSVTLLE